MGLHYPKVIVYSIPGEPFRPQLAETFSGVVRALREGEKVKGASIYRIGELRPKMHAPVPMPASLAKQLEIPYVRNLEEYKSEDGEWYWRIAPREGEK